MLVADAINAAYRENNIVVVGEEPTAAETAEGLTLLNTFWRALLGHNIGENLTPWPVPPPTNQTGIPEYIVREDLGSPFYLLPLQNTRLQIAISTATSIKFPANPDDGARMAIVDVGSGAVQLTLHGNGSLIEGQTQVVDTVAAFSGKTYFFRADLASWQPIEELALDDQLPLPQEYDDLFITALAIRLAARHDKEIAQETVAVFNDLLSKAKARYTQTQNVAIADPRLTETQQSFGGPGVSWMI